jgi:hypothetical protein
MLDYDAQRMRGRSVRGRKRQPLTRSHLAQFLLLSYLLHIMAEAHLFGQVCDAC